MTYANVINLESKSCGLYEEGEQLIINTIKHVPAIFPAVSQNLDFSSSFLQTRKYSYNKMTEICHMHFKVILMLY